jgi:acyl-CoA thioester hydrolase
MVKISAAVAHPWLCDSMGHLNTRHFVAMFDDAAIVLVQRIGVPKEQPCAPQHGWADVRNEIDYLAEVPVGTAVDIFSSISHIGTKSLTIASEMRGVNGQVLHARFNAVMVHFDLTARRAASITDDIRTLVEQFRLVN